jgi:hypothetical protein
MADIREETEGAQERGETGRIRECGEKTGAHDAGRGGA